MLTVAVVAAFAFIGSSLAYFSVLRARWTRSPWMSARPEDAWALRLVSVAALSSGVLFLSAGAALGEAMDFIPQSGAMVAGIAWWIAAALSARGITSIERAVALQAVRDADAAASASSTS